MTMNSDAKTNLIVYRVTFVVQRYSRLAGTARHTRQLGWWRQCITSKKTGRRGTLRRESHTFTPQLHYLHHRNFIIWNLEKKEVWRKDEFEVTALQRCIHASDRVWCERVDFPPIDYATYQTCVCLLYRFIFLFEVSHKCRNSTKYQTKETWKK